MPGIVYPSKQRGFCTHSLTRNPQQNCTWCNSLSGWMSAAPERFTSELTSKIEESIDNANAYYDSNASSHYNRDEYYMKNAKEAIESFERYAFNYFEDSIRALIELKKREVNYIKQNKQLELEISNLRKSLTNKDIEIQNLRQELKQANDKNKQLEDINQSCIKDSNKLVDAKLTIFKQDELIKQLNKAIVEMVDNNFYSAIKTNGISNGMFESYNDLIAFNESLQDKLKNSNIKIQQITNTCSQYESMLKIARNVYSALLADYLVNLKKIPNKVIDGTAEWLHFELPDNVVFTITNERNKK